MKHAISYNLFSFLISSLLLHFCNPACPGEQLYISACNYACFAECDQASSGDLIGAVNGCFHDVWGFGGLGLFGGVEVYLFICENHCGCNENPVDGCLECEMVSSNRLNGGSCMSNFGCLEVLGPTDTCCPAVLKAGGYQCILGNAVNCDDSTPESYGDLIPGMCEAPCRWDAGCDGQFTDNGRCSLTQTDKGATGFFPGGCTPSNVCSSTESEGSPDQSKSDRKDGADRKDWEKIGVIVGCILGGIPIIAVPFWKLRNHHRTTTQENICTTEELMEVGVSAVTSPIRACRRQAGQLADDESTVSESVVASIISSHLSPIQEGSAALPPGTDWVRQTYQTETASSLSRADDTESSTDTAATSAT